MICLSSSHAYSVGALGEIARNSRDVSGTERSDRPKQNHNGAWESLETIESPPWQWRYAMQVTVVELTLPKHLTEEQRSW